MAEKLVAMTFKEASRWIASQEARTRYLETREAEAWALLTDVRFCGRNGLHDDIDKWLAAYSQ
jgi:hypothetical protein